MIAPKAKKIDHPITMHNDTRNDPYYWLNDRENEDVIAYLEEENKYTEEVLAPTKALQEKLFEEMKGRIKEDDSSVPYKFNGYWYLTEFQKGKEYPFYIRRKDELTNEDELLFNVNEMAEGHSYYQLGGLSISANNQYVSFGVDNVSRRIYTIQIKDLTTGEILPDLIENTTGGSTWASDNKTLFYTRKDETLRAFQIWKHRLGTDSKDDVLVYEEEDDTFNTYVYKSKSRAYIIIGTSSGVSDEFRYINANEADAEFKIFQPRERDLEYSIEHFGDDFYIQTNIDDAINYKLMKTAVNQTEKEHWIEVISHRDNVFIEGFEIFKNFLVVEERQNGLIQINIKAWDLSTDYYLPFNEETYTAGVGTNPDFDTDSLRYIYTSLTTPSSVIDFNMIDQTSEIKKEQTVLGDFDKNNYTSERIWARAETES